MTRGPSSRLNLSDLQGLCRLTLDAARMITDVVEDTHATILARMGRPFLDPPGAVVLSTGWRNRTTGGSLYRGIHLGYDAVELGLNAALCSLAPAAGERFVSTLERERLLAVLNGVWGHHLVASRNPLAIHMSFRHHGVPMALEERAIREAIGTPGRKLLVLAHGLCGNDLTWEQNGHDLGAQLARDLGYTPVYLHYNTGLRVSTNGKRFAELLERLVGAWPEPLEELTVLGHSMGGLVARSAAHYAELSKQAWRGRLSRLVFLGTPHHGSRLERAGHWADQLLDLTPYSAPFRRLGASRSAGILDLRHGSMLDEDWRGFDPLGYRRDTRHPVPLPAGVECYALAATLGTNAGDAKGWLLGDGLVSVTSALGIHWDPKRNLAIPPSRQWVGYAMRHRELLQRPDVYAKLQEWLAS